MIPETTREALTEALTRFDREQRDSPEWQGWEGRGTQRYALVHDGRRYPPKQIIALATGLPRTGFSGGVVANGYLQQYGFSVEALDNTPEPPQVWWVNQGATYRAGRDGGFLWSP